MRSAYVFVCALVLLSACSQAPVLQGEHYPYFDECELLQDHNLYAELDCTEYAIKAYEDESAVLPEVCEVQGNSCESFETEVGYTELFVRIQTAQPVEAAQITYSTLTRQCQVRENNITCSLPLVAMDRQHKQPFELTIDGQPGIILAYV